MGTSREWARPVTKGHLSKDCRRRLSCKICSLKHPTMLHIERNKPEEIRRQNEDRATAVNSSLVSLEKPAHTGAGDNQTLAIVPVKVKLSSLKGYDGPYILTKALTF